MMASVLLQCVIAGRLPDLPMEGQCSMNRAKQPLDGLEQLILADCVEAMHMTARTRRDRAMRTVRRLVGFFGRVGSAREWRRG